MTSTFESIMISCVLAAVAAGAARAAEPEIEIDRAGIVITRDTRIKPGTYRVTDGGEQGVLIIKGGGVTLDFGGAELIGCEEGAAPDEFTGIGIVSSGNARVTIRNARLRGFKTAILVEEGDGAVIEGCDLSGNFAQRLRSTPEREDGSDWLWPHANDEDQWRKNYGAGIYLKDCKKAVVSGNRGHGSQNGILLSGVSESEVYDNDFSFNSGWGLAMWRSCGNLVTHNKLDWCVRGYSHGVYWRGQDSAGILFFEQCSDNFFGWNSATHGGDGFFLYAGHETMQRTGKGGCNNNVLFKNDFSHAVANGIEATFSDNNRFIENLCNDCQHGFWLGYSYNNQVVGNEVRDCAGAGIAWEHGHDNLIAKNLFGGNPVAVDLWWDADKDLMESPYGRRASTDSKNNRISGNVFDGDRIAIRLRETQNTVIESNVFIACGEAVAAGDNCAGTRERGSAVYARGANAAKAWDAAGESLPEFDPPKTAGSLEAFLPPGTLRGRQYILVDEWGPYDFKQPKVWPARASGGREVTFYVYGPGETAARGGEANAAPGAARFRVTRATEGVAVAPREGPMPGAFTVRAERPGLHEFEIGLEATGVALDAEGTLFSADWTVRFFHWTEDPRENQSAWERLLRSEPVLTLTVDALNFQWQGGAPHKDVNADRFGTLATATVPLPAGAYEVTTISDDGVRLWVDGNLVIDNWTWHAPAEDRATVTLEAGDHDFRIEHFEIDGYAALSAGARKK